MERADREVVCSGLPSVVSLHSLRSVPVNHPNPDGSPSSVTKKVMFGRGVVPHVLQMAIASFPPNGSFPAHTHDSMHEIFIALDGKAEFFLSPDHHTGRDSGSSDGNKIVIQKGTVIHVPPGTRHSGVSTADGLRLLSLAIQGPAQCGK